MSDRRELFRDQRRMVRLATVVVVLATVIAAALLFYDVAIGIALAAFGLSTSVALLLMGDSLAGLRAELDRAEGNLQRATEAAEIIELLRSIDARLERRGQQRTEAD